MALALILTFYGTFFKFISPLRFVLYIFNVAVKTKSISDGFSYSVNSKNTHQNFNLEQRITWQRNLCVCVYLKLHIATSNNNTWLWGWAIIMIEEFNQYLRLALNKISWWSHKPKSDLWNIFAHFENSWNYNLYNPKPIATAREGYCLNFTSLV